MFNFYKIVPRTQYLQSLHLLMDRISESLGEKNCITASPVTFFLNVKTQVMQSPGMLLWRCSEMIVLNPYKVPAFPTTCGKMQNEKNELAISIPILHWLHRLFSEHDSWENPWLLIKTAS